MKKILFVAALCAVMSAVVFTSCSEKNKKPVQISTSIIDDVESGDVSEIQVWHPSEKKICIVFGYGYNEEEYVQNIVETLVKKYGLDDGEPDSGMIFSLVFPNDFPSNKITRLPSLIGDRELAGLIIVGAPEDTNRALASLEDEWDSQETMIPYPIYAFFPQDDVAGIEATSNFVVDRALEGSGSEDNEETDKEEVSQTQIEDLDALLDRAIEYMLLTQEPLPTDSKLIEHVASIVGKNYKVSRYIDAESGLQSINHFVIEDKKQ